MERDATGKDVNFVVKAKQVVEKVLDGDIFDNAWVGTVVGGLTLVQERIASIIPKTSKQ